MTRDTQPPAWRRGIDFYERLLRFVAGVSTAALVIIMMIQVVGRYVFGGSPIWAEELCRYILVWQTFLMVGYAYTKGELMSVDILPDLMTPKVRFVVKLVMLIPILIFLYLMVVNAHTYAVRFQRQVIPAGDFIWNSLFGRDLGLSVFWIYISVAVGSALLALHMVVAVIRDFLDLRAGVTPTRPDNAHSVKGAE